MKNKCLLNALLFSLFIPVQVFGQRMLGVATSNWGGTTSLYLNPARMADSRQKFVLDIVALNAYAENDVGTLNSQAFMSQLNSLELLNANDIFKFDNNKTVNLMMPYLEVRGPGFTWNIDHKNSVGFTTRLRAASQFSNINEKIYRTLLDPTYSVSGNSDYNVTSRDFKWNAATWGEMGFSYARVVMDEGANFLSVGATVRYLSGAAYATMNGKSVDGQYYAAEDSLRLTNTNIEFSSNIINSYKKVESEVPGVSTPSMFSRYFSPNKGSSGVGGDIGFSYEFRPRYEKYLYETDGKKRIADHSSVKYKVRVSASVTDLGSITYSEKGSKQAVATGSGYIRGNTASGNINSYRSFTDYAKARGFRVDSATRATVYHLPTSLVMAVDYKVAGDFYVNVNSMLNIANRAQTGNHFYDQVTITPRYDKSVVSIGVPITYNMLTKSVKAGLGMRLGGFYIGGDDLLGLIGNNQYGVNIYAGLFVPINYEKPRDRDRDRITDRHDHCPDSPGIWAFKGCPDPDRDLDGIANAKDWCPDLAGVASANGCPDKDRDGVADAADKCPDVAGLAVLAGCPDRDKDGVTDADDACPNIAGPAALKGCPDTDKDGLTDNIDKCPMQAGPVALEGCPDTDNDGIADNVDRCPATPGPASNFGCPEIRTEVLKRLSHAATALEFETGKAVIKGSSYAMLDEIVVLLNEYVDYYIDIEGHTDAVGSAESNIVLSEGRAGSVMEYFVAKGIAAERFEIRGMGETMPVASNATTAGKAQNRRVKMTLKLRSK